MKIIHEEILHILNTLDGGRFPGLEVGVDVKEK